MRLGHVHHAVEPEVIGGHLARVHSCAKTFLVEAAVDPAIGQPELVGRRMVVEHAFGGVQDIRLFYSGDVRFLRQF